MAKGFYLLPNLTTLGALLRWEVSIWPTRHYFETDGLNSCGLNINYSLISRKNFPECM